MEYAGPRTRRVAVTATALLLTGTAAACGSAASSTGSGPPSPTRRPHAHASASPTGTPPSRTPPPRGPRLPQLSGRPVVGAAPPPWLGTRVLPRTAGGFGEVRPTPPELVRRRFTLPDRLPELPGHAFASRVSSPAPAAVLRRSTWQPGCPVAAPDLSWLRLTFWGFDDQRHTGELLVNTSAAAALVEVFHRLYDARFPLEEMRINRRSELDAPPTGDGNDTSAFACRATRGSSQKHGTVYSQHAYGLAVDVNPFQNPYHNGAVVLPELASAYLDRGDVRPGMILAGGPVVQAFAAIGWVWGGSWHSLKDLQHFSANGR